MKKNVYLMNKQKDKNGGKVYEDFKLFSAFVLYLRYQFYVLAQKGDVSHENITCWSSVIHSKR